jgi:hypothetical protein
MIGSGAPLRRLGRGWPAACSAHAQVEREQSGSGHVLIDVTFVE